MRTTHWGPVNLVPAARFAEHRDQRAKGPMGMVEMGIVDSDQLPVDVTGHPTLFIPMRLEVAHLGSAQVAGNHPATSVCEFLRLRLGFRADRRREAEVGP